MALKRLDADAIQASIAVERPGEPYYICAPPFIASSAGVKVLHLLSHFLILKGQSTWLFIPGADETALSPNLASRLLTRRVADQHRKDGRKSIVIYPEVASETQDGGAVVVRYVLNFPGHLDGPGELIDQDYIFAYSEELRQMTPGCADVVYIPASDPVFFSPPPTPVQREGVAVYAGKYQSVHGGQLIDIPDVREVLTRDDDRQSPESLRRVFQSRRAVYVFENTAIATEALLCGCAVVRVRNPTFDCIIAGERLGSEGYVDIGLQDAGKDITHEIDRALLATPLFRKRYLSTFAQLSGEIDQFISATQTLAAAAEARPFQPAMPQSSRLEHVTEKLHKWARSGRELGWIRTIRLGAARRFRLPVA